MFGILSGIANAFGAHAANKSLSKLQKMDPVYQANPLAAQYLGLSQNLFNGRSAGAPQEERNIFTNNANFNATVGRNAASGSQALALAAAGQGQTDQSLENLQLQEQQNKMGMLSNLNNAYGQQIQEGDKVAADNQRRWQDLVSIRGAQQKNRSNAVTGIFNGLQSDFNDVLGLGSAGAFSAGGIFGKKAAVTAGASGVGGY